MAIMIVFSTCSQVKPNNIVLVKGGTFMNTKSNYYGKGAEYPFGFKDRNPPNN